LKIWEQIFVDSVVERVEIQKPYLAKYSFTFEIIEVHQPYLAQTRSYLEFY